jgi:hypothetical protein
VRAIRLAMALAVLSLGSGPGWAAAQAIPDEAPAGALRLRIVEPPDGAIIPGSSIRVVVAREPGPDEETGRDVAVFVFLDGAQQSSLLPNETHVTLDNVAPGRHRVSVLAIDRDNRVVDRHDISVHTVALASGPVSNSTGERILSSVTWSSVDTAAAVLAGLGLATIALTVSATRQKPRRSGRLGGTAAGRLFLVAAALAACGRAGAQTEGVIARQSPVVPTRSASPSDPTGTYSGLVMLTIADQPPALQMWRIDIQSQPCPECLPGQHFLSGTNFSGINFVGGLVERGGVRGMVNPDGKTADLALTAANCLFISPSGSDRNYGGRLWGGSFGETPGNPLVVANGSVTGRISGRDCFGRAVVADVSLQRQSTSVPAPCVSIQGLYAATYANTLGANGGGAVSIVQDGCFFAAELPGIGAQLEGVMTGPNSADIHVRDVCAASVYEGTLSVAGNTVQGNYSGAAGTAVSACPAGTASGTFTLTHP